MYYSQFDGIYFVEGSLPDAEVIREISTSINEFFGQSQLKSLDDVKRKMVNAVRALGGNAIVEFKYGQKSSFWQSLLGLDDVSWYASGKIARINPESLPHR